jgi:multidrug efflux pump subunit AcrA (membrane-fusion protein)
MGEAHQPGSGGHEALPEGVEQAPPGTRTMALVRWALVGLMAFAAIGAWGYHLATRSGSSLTQGQKFICPMHPQILTGHKGECPICGMDLVPAGTTATPAAAAKPAADANVASGAMAPLANPGHLAEYTCPMDPEVVSTDPKFRCPKCNMKLVPRAAGVPGLVPVELSADRVQLMGMRTATATREKLGTSLRAVGFVTPTEDGVVSINTRYSGWVESLRVAQTGQLVQAGDVLLTIFSPDLQNAQASFLNTIKWADKRPVGSGAPAAASDLERDARLRLELLGVHPIDIDELAATGTAKRAMPVRAPSRGYVARKSVLKGVYVTAGTELFQLADLTTVWVLVDIHEADLSRVRVGQLAGFSTSSAAGKRFEGRVQFIYPALNSGSRTLQARVELANPRLELRPGMFGDVVLETGADEAVVIPADALVDTGEHRYVFVDRGAGRFEPRAVKTGAAGDGKVAVLQGLAEGERVVTKANFLLDSESRLRAAVEGQGR